MTTMKVADKDYENSINVTVEWRNITLNAQTAAGPKAILKGLTGHASPGELVAIMGPSGAGKTTLLNCLAQRTPGALGGEVLLNGVAWREQFFAILAYMPQDEVFLAELTPREHLGFMAQLRLHKSASDFQSARVEQVISEMKLQGVANQVDLWTCKTLTSKAPTLAHLLSRRFLEYTSVLLFLLPSCPAARSLPPPASSRLISP